MRVIEHVQKRHLQEPHVAEMLTRMLVDVGILNPDGTPAMAPRSPEAPAMSPSPGARRPLDADSDQPGSGGSGKTLDTGVDETPAPLRFGEG